MQTIRLCAFCGRGRLAFQTERIVVRERVGTGWLTVEAVVPLGRCDRCGTAVLDKEAEAAIDAALARARARRERFEPG